MALRKLPSIVENFINGKFVASNSSTFTDVFNPATQELICKVPQSTENELKSAEIGALEAYRNWREVPVQQRQRIFFKLQALIKQHTEDLAEVITKEQGKTLSDSRGDVFRGLEVVEAVCNVSTLLMGETVEGLARGVDTYSFRQPLGVTAGIAPFNFPAMIPLWVLIIKLLTFPSTFLRNNSYRGRCFPWP